MAEIIALKAASVMYQVSLPQAGDDEVGGDPDAKEDNFEEESAWGLKDYKPWED